jgi:hypothetical protein
MSPEAILIIGRVIERLLATLFGGMSLWLGWRLFWVRAQALNQQAEFSFKSLIVRFRRVAPGIFFAAFGAALLSVSVWKPLALNNVTSSISYFNTNAGLEDLRAMNFIVQISKIPTSESLSPTDRGTLQKKAAAFAHVRDGMLISIVGQEKFALWLRYKDHIDQTPPEQRETITEIQRLADDLGEL